MSMPLDKDEYLNIAYRAWSNERKESKSKPILDAEYNRLIVFDTETTTDVTQRFRFGFARETRRLAKGQYDTKREMLVYADDFEAREPHYYRVAMDYARKHEIPVISQAEFAKEFLRGACYSGSKYTALVGFNLPFDLSRIAYDVGESTALKGGFTFRMFPKRPPCPDDCHEVHKNHRPTPCKRVVLEVDKDGNAVYFCPEILKNPDHKCIPPACKDDCQAKHKHRKPACPTPWETECHEEHEHRREAYFSDFDPTLRIKHLDSKKAFIRWGVPAQLGTNRSNTQGQFIDLRQLIFGMTNRAVSLAGACRLFNLPEEYCKTHVEDYSAVTEEFIDYARQDVKATEALAVTVLHEYDTRHYRAIGLPATRVFSPATMGKAYLAAMGITPDLDRGEEWSPQDNTILGYCTSTFYGARAEAHIRRYPMPVTVCDFTNMYGSVNMLMDLWKYKTNAIRIDDSASELERFTALVADVAKNGTQPLLDQEMWKGLVGFAQIVPDGDIVPVRARYKKDSFNVGHSVFYSAEPVWYTYPDILASAMLTGKLPDIRRVMRFTYVPGKELPGLKPVVFGGVTLVDPRTQDLFRTLIEERSVMKKRMKKIEYGSPEYVNLDKGQESNKVGVNAVSYGVNVEMQASEDEIVDEIDVYGKDDEPWKCTPSRVELAGKYCYPPIGAVITGAARLMLSITEKLVYDAGGNWVFGDTDSMAIVTTKDGGLVPCPGGNLTMPDGRDAVKALSRAEVVQLRETINLLNPYDRGKVPELLKDETEKANRTSQVYGFAISAKRYCLFFYDQNGRPVIPADEFDKEGNYVKPAEIDGKAAYMQHGLGLYLNPDDLNWATKPDGRENGHWMRQVWQWMLDRAHGISDGEYPEWADSPALVRSGVSSPHIMKVFKDWNAGKEYPDQIKPFNFLLMATERGYGFRVPKDLAELEERSGKPVQESRRFIAPYSRDPKDWFSCDWYDLHQPGAEPVQISTTEEAGKVFIKSFTKVLGEYEFHPEIKSAMPNGKACRPRYSGVLGRRIVRVWDTVHIGKESNKLEEVDSHEFNSQDEVLTQYPKDDRSLIGKAFGDMTLREIARAVNAESKTLGEWGEHDSMRDVYGYPLPHEVDHKPIARYLNGSRMFNPHIQAIIMRVAAKRVANRIGIDAELIGISSNRHFTSPSQVLAMWREEGCPGPTYANIDLTEMAL